MNRFKGTIKSIQSKDALSLVKVEVNDLTFTTVVIDTPLSLPSLKIGGFADVIFKESEVVLANPPIEVSMQNQIHGTVKEINEGELLSKVKIESDIGNIVALITTSALQRLNIVVEGNVIALVKTNEVMLSYD